MQLRPKYAQTGEFTAGLPKIPAKSCALPRGRSMRQLTHCRR